MTAPSGVREDPFYWLRVVGGSLYLVGVVMMAWNFIRSASARAVPAPAPAGAS